MIGTSPAEGWAPSYQIISVQLVIKGNLNFCTQRLYRSHPKTLPSQNYFQQEIQILLLLHINIVLKIFKKKALIKKTTSNLNFRISLINGKIWILLPHFGIWTSHLVTNAVIWSQPVPDLQSKNFFYKSFSICKIELENAIRKITWVIISSQIKSFRHNLFLTFNLKTFFTKVSPFGQLNYKVPSEKLNKYSYGHKISHFVTTYS